MGLRSRSGARHRTDQQPLIQRNGFWKLTGRSPKIDDTLSMTNVNIGDVMIPETCSPKRRSLNEIFRIDERVVGADLVVFDRWETKVHEN